MRATAKDFPSLTLDERGLCDLELLATGGFSPLTTFMGRADYDRVVAEMRLADGTLWPLPVTLPVDPEATGAAVGKPLALRDVYGNLLAFLHVDELFAFDKEAEAKGAYGTTDAKHPAVAYLNKQPGHYASGTLEVIRVPPHYDFVELRKTPAELREHFAKQGWDKVVAFQTRNPLHRAHEELTKRAAQQIGGGTVDPSGRRRGPSPATSGPLHPRPMLPGPGRQPLRPEVSRPEPPAPGDADGRTARGLAPRDHPPELRLHRHHRRPRPRRTRLRLLGQAPSTGLTMLRKRCRPTATRSAWAWSTSS